MPTFKHGRLFEVLMNSQDVSAYFFSSAWNAYVQTDEVTTAKGNAGWRSFLSGDAFSQWIGYGYFDTALTGIRSTIQVLPSTTTGILSYAPAGATAIGDQVRLLNFNTSDYKETSHVKSAVGFKWAVGSTAPVGIGASLHPLASESVGTITGTGDALLNAGVAGTGFIAHLHVTAYTAGTHQFKLQDATTQGGAYTDIAGGAFTNMTAVGAQRLAVVGTVRQWVRCVATIGTAAATYSVACARFPT